MKKISVLMLGMVVSGCADFGNYLDQTLNPWGPANSPIGDSETFQRVRGNGKTQLAPLAMENGDVWPGAPAPVPSLQDVSNPDSVFNLEGGKSVSALNADLREQLGNGETLSIGEETARQRGIARQSEAYTGAQWQLPSHVADRASHFMEKKTDATVAIPNGDGTTTLIAPDGSIRVIRGMPAAVAGGRRPLAGSHLSGR
ncbi:hypothetical protein [Oecophyllibacter saccharovorans]|uniref:hypothetical protein n=1 Tax=Oecophyllibacter saccharovorans TaxID=2558360 RepID=UPI00116A94BA|nr:hypothetical protein [Oecophyllibacter saccharovorans]TPW34610.1 hypothetical protein E3203_03390 [Oecophyllibacter saccharovorans]